MRELAALFLTCTAVSMLGCGQGGESESAPRKPMSLQAQLSAMSDGAKAIRGVNQWEPSLGFADFVTNWPRTGKNARLVKLVYGCQPDALSFAEMREAYWEIDNAYKRSRADTKKFFNLSDQLSEAIIPKAEAARGTWALTAAWDRLLMAQSEYMNPIGKLSSYTAQAAGRAQNALNEAGYLSKGKGNRDDYETACDEAEAAAQSVEGAFLAFESHVKKVGPLAEAGAALNAAFDANPQTRWLQRELKRRYPEGLGLPETDGGL